jgi:hypothetical protein
MHKRIGDVTVHADEGKDHALRCISIGAHTRGDGLRFVSVDIFFSPEEARKVAKTIIEFADRLDQQFTVCPALAEVAA